MPVVNTPATAYMGMIRNLLKRARNDVSMARGGGMRTSKFAELDQAIEALDVIEAELREKAHHSQGESNAKTVKT